MGRRPKTPYEKELAMRKAEQHNANRDRRAERAKRGKKPGKRMVIAHAPGQPWILREARD